MIRFATLSVALLCAAPAAAQDQPAATPIIPAPAAIGATPGDGQEIARKVADCEGEKFTFAWGAGANPTKVTLCSDKGASPDEIVRMLEDGAAKIERTTGIREDRRVVLVQQIRGKIAELKAREAAGNIAASPVMTQGAGSTPAPITLPAAAPSAQLLPKPVLNFTCYALGDIGSGGPCDDFTPETRLLVTAGEAIPAATRLRFFRRGKQRAELPLGPMRKGELARIALPRAVCDRVLSTQMQIEVVHGGRAVDTRGPYAVRC